MNNRQARLFAVAATGLSALLFLGLTLDSHRQFPELTNAQDITPQVRHGMDVWHKYNCINCHPLLGEGPYSAPDLTKIPQPRGEPYLKAYMRDPSRFYNEQTHRRLMPRQDLAEDEISDLIAFLDWVSKVDNQGWPPRPILVTGSFAPGAATLAAAGSSGETPTGAQPVDAGDDPRALGEQLFKTATPACNACHSTVPGADMAGPSLAGIGTRAAQTVASPDYHGKAKDAGGYIRESILSPSAHIVPGEMYSADGTSFMPTGYGQSLSDEQVGQLVAFLETLK